MIRRVFEKFLHKESIEECTCKYNVEEDIKNMFDSLVESDIKLLVGDDIAEHEEILASIIRDLRSKVKNRYGFILPAINIKQESKLQENEYKICAKGKVVFNEFVIPTEKDIKKEITKGLLRSLRNNLSCFFTNEITEKYVSIVQQNNGALAWDVSMSLPITSLKTILIDILESGKSIHNIIDIFEKINAEIYAKEICSWTRNPHEISQKVIQSIT